MFNSDDIRVTRRLAEEGLLGVVQSKPEIEWIPFEEARRFVRSLGLKNSEEWRAYYKSDKRPKDIPSSPWGVYKEEWKGMGDWLGTGYLPFKEAREFARSLGFKNSKEWHEYSKSGKRPKNIPSCPARTYKAEWKGMGDWLGTGNISFKNNVYCAFKEARKFIRSLGLKSQKEWYEYVKSGKKPKGIPAAPWKVYKEEWGGMRDWLGEYSRFLSFREAREFSRSLRLKSTKEWRRFCSSGNKPTNIPSDPYAVYGGAFKGFGDWLGTGNIAPFNKVYRPFKEARKFIHSLGLKNCREWREYSKSGKCPEDISHTPWNTYKEEWKGLGDWLGTGNIHPSNRVFRPFKEARQFARSLGLKGRKEWEEYSKSGKRPKDIPSNPQLTYKAEWKGFGDWLGTGNIASHNKVYRSFKEAREFARSLGLKSHKEWREYSKSGKRPKDIPSAPWNTYKKEWKGLGDWLGTGAIAPKDREFRSFREARKFVRPLGLKNSKEWNEYSKSGKRPKDIPSCPEKTHKEEWKGYGDWLGTGNIANFNKKFRSFKEGRKFARSLGLKSSAEWKEYAKSGERLKDIPSNPGTVYKEDWKGWGDWLGTGNIATSSRVYRPFKEARKFVRSLGFKNTKEWHTYVKSGEKPKDIPSNPQKVYEKDWKGFGDWLGTSKH